MKNKIIISFLALILISAAFIIFFSRTKKANAPEQPPAIVQPETKTETIKPDASKATSKNYQESSEKYKYQISVNYPFFDGLAEKKIMDAINSQIEKDVQVEVDRYIAEVRRNKISPTFGYLTGNYTYSVTTEKILSVKIEMEKYLSGGEKSQSFIVALDFDLGSGKKISSTK
jgi:hypothetical protein